MFKGRDMKKVAIVALLSLLLTSLAVGCVAPNPVDGIFVFKARPGQMVPTGEFAGTGNPHPSGVQATFNPGDKMFIILSMSEKLRSDVTFSRYAFFNEETGQEVNVGSPEDFKTWEPGQTDLVAFHNPWGVPDRPGEYKLRIYLGKRIVASAVFRVE
jgi:hypothetical protein